MPAYNRIRMSVRRFVALAFALACINLAFLSSAHAQSESTIYSFTGAGDGASPASTLIPDSSGNYYGTTFSAGSFSGTQCEFIGCGVVFELSPNGSGGWNESVIYTFTGHADGAGPAAGLAFDSLGNLYGTAQGGGIVNGNCSSFSAPGCGVVFKLAPNGSGGWTESVIYSFKGGSDGWDVEAPVTFDSAGNMYGTTSTGGPHKGCASGYGCGEVFKLAPNGSGGWNYSVLHFFTNGPDGGRPFSGVTLDALGNIFTTTIQGGDLSDCGEGGCGALVQLAPNGSGGYRFRVLHTFTNGADGGVPFGAPMLDAAGNIYAPAQQGGHMAGVCHSIGGCGVIFEAKRTATGYTPAIAYTFTGGNDGYLPVTNLTADSSGNLYGAADGKPADVSESSCVFDACGFVYKLTPSGSGWSESVLYTFSGGTDGGIPSNTSGVTIDGSGHIFGTVEEFGIANGCSSYANGCGVAYEITP